MRLIRAKDYADVSRKAANSGNNIAAMSTKTRIDRICLENIYFLQKLQYVTFI